MINTCSQKVVSGLLVVAVRRHNGQTVQHPVSTFADTLIVAMEPFTAPGNVVNAVENRSRWKRSAYHGSKY